MRFLSGITVPALSAAALILSTGVAPAAADPSTVEDFAYPGAAAILSGRGVVGGAPWGTPPGGADLYSTQSS